MTTRRPIRCDCHGTVVCGYHEGDKIVIVRREHGRDHCAVVVVDKKCKSEDNLDKKLSSSEG